MSNGIFPGSKFYRYDDNNEPIVVRIVNVDTAKNVIRYINDAGVKWKANLDEFKSNYRMLTPDANISFSIVDLNGDKDIVVAAKKMPKHIDEANRDDRLPDIICRQMSNDIFANIPEPNRRIIGVCVSQDTCPPNIDYKLLLSCTGIDKSTMISVYLDDSLESIMKFVNTKEMDSILRELSKKYINYYEGLTTSVRDLLFNNRFMFDYRKLFGIMEIPFHVDPESSHLNAFNVAFLSNELKVNITETYVLKYDKSIDMETIYRDYVLVTPAADGYKDVYIVGYDVEK